MDIGRLVANVTANALAENEPPAALHLPTEAGAMFCSIAPPRLNFARPQKGRALFNAAGSSRASGPGFASELNVFQRTLGTRLSILPESAR